MKNLLALFLVFLAGCGGGSSISCNYTVLFNGDSTMLGMTDSLFLTPYDVIYEPGRGTDHILSIIDSGRVQEILDEELPDIVVVGSGIWDIDNPHNSLVDYEEKLTHVLTYYLANVDNVVFMLTLYGEGNSHNGDVDRYNEVARQVSSGLGVTTFDPNLLSYNYSDGIHLDTQSNVLLAELFNTFIGAEFQCIPF